MVCTAAVATYLWQGTTAGFERPNGGPSGTILSVVNFIGVRLLSLGALFCDRSSVLHTEVAQFSWHLNCAELGLPPRTYKPILSSI
jgi:hypothetical protein